MPELVSTLCTFLVLSPLVLTPGPGAVPLQADGHGRGVLDDRRLHPVADAGPGLSALTGSSRTTAHGHGGGTATATHAAVTTQPATKRRRARDLSDQRQRPRQRPPAGTDRAGRSPAGSR